MLIQDLPERLASRIAPADVHFENTPCWHFNGKWNSGNGYSKVRWQGKGKVVHRLTYHLLVGPIDERLLIDHRCRNRACCNPRHLKPETPKANTLLGKATLFKRKQDYAIDRTPFLCEAV